MRLGCDPEVFLINPDGTPLSALGLIGGNKAHPLQITNMRKGFTLQEDNVALEFGIPPAKSRDLFVKYIQSVMVAGIGHTGKQFSNLSCIKFPKEQLQHPMAHVFGCEPDFNAWTKEKNDKPYCDDETLRTAGGHIHIETDLDPNEVGKACDLFLGVPALLMDGQGILRQQLYGKAGAIRYKPYGVEYRVLSNFWIFKTKHIKWVWDSVAQALEWVKNKNETPTGVEHIINMADTELATLYLKKYNLYVC